jgi:5'-3' exonuclease
MHYQITSTYAWYGHTFELPNNLDDYDWSLDDEYITMLEKKVPKCLNKIKQEYRSQNKNIILATDCRRRDIWRKEYFPNYKISRDLPKKPKKPQPNFRTVFNYISKQIVPELKERYNLIGSPSAEGDDIIATLTNFIKEKEPKRKIVIVANDHDFLQLADENVKIVNLQGKILNENISHSAKRKLNVKIITGDKADDIPQVFPRCGEKTARKLIENPELLKEKFLEIPGSKEQFKLNKKLIDFEYIPKEIQDDIINQWQEIQTNNEIF